MKKIKSPKEFLREAFFGGSLGLLMSPFKEPKGNRFEKKEDIKHKNFYIPVWRDNVFGEDVLGLPQRVGTITQAKNGYFPAWYIKRLDKIKSIIDKEMTKFNFQNREINFENLLPPKDLKVPEDLSHEKKW